MVRVYFKGDRNDIRNLAIRLRDILSGRAPDRSGIASGFLLCLGFGALSDIKDAYVTKADGGTDEMGISWPDLSPKTKAYGRRFGPGEQSSLKQAAGVGRGARFAPGNNVGLLTAEQLKMWKKIFARTLARLRLSLPEDEAKARAAQIAWATLKRDYGARTKLDVYGNRKVQILRDTGVLLNSLSPGILTGGPAPSYSKPTAPGGSEQVFEQHPGSIIVGTNVPYAAAHNKPLKAKLPRRQILPDEDQVPDVWWERWLGIGMKALEAGSAILFREAA